MKSDLDRIDLELLAALQKDARLTNKELANRVGLSPSSCLERVRRLTARGVLRGYHARVDGRALGVNLQALLMVRLVKHSKQAFEDFRDHVQDLPEVVGTYMIGGAHDFLLHVAVPSSDHLRDLELESVATRPEVEHIETCIVFDHWLRHAFPHFLGGGTGRA